MTTVATNVVSPRRALTVWCIAVFGAGLAVVGLALLVGRGAPPPAPPGLPDDARLPAWIGELVSFTSLVLGVVIVGLGAMAGLVPEGAGDDLRGAATEAATFWGAVTVLQVGLTSWELKGTGGTFESTRVQALLVQLGLIVLAAACWALVRGTSRRLQVVATVLASAALLPVVLTGHPRTAEHRVVAGVAVGSHVIAAAVWVGGLAILGWMAVIGDRRWAEALGRFSRLALICAVGLVVSGGVAATGRLSEMSDLFDSRYGAIVTLKIVLVAGAIAIGWAQRRKVVDRVTGQATVGVAAFVALASLELATMTVALALASALSRTPPPT